LVVRWLVTAIVFGGLAIVPARAELLVFAAASLSDVTTAMAERFTAETGEAVTLSFGSSSTLARQIEAGAPADVYLSANREWVEHVREFAGYGEAMKLFSNALVIVSPAGADVLVALEDLPDALGDQRLAVGDPEHVPAGQYAREAMQAAGVWVALESRLAPAEDARTALRLVEHGAVPYGIVYRTDALAGNAAIAGEIDPALHTPVTYYLALPGEPKPEAAAFAGFVTSGAADDEITRFGFVPAGKVQ
jgi:molybdate transport system substrate-binding protein